MTTREKLDQMKASEKKNAEALAAYRGSSWRKKQIHRLKYLYGRLAEQWGRKTNGDDRDVYCNTYQLILEGLKTLPAEPALYVRVAMVEKMRIDRALMDRIAANFGENTMGGNGGGTA